MSVAHCQVNVNLFQEIFQMSANHETLVSLFEIYTKENEKFATKGNKAAGTRARKALAEFCKLAKERRKEIQESKNAETA